MLKTIKIAIDGPAGAGKSTISRRIAEELGYLYIDTGAMYRAVGLAVINAGADTGDCESVKRILDGIDIDIRHEEARGQTVYLNGTDVSDDIRRPEISVAASNVAVIPEVRMKLVELQRRLAERSNVVMDGRDIGTYVLPDANVKIFLTAGVEERAARRWEELMRKGTEVTYEEVKRDMEYRDKNDSDREIAPLKPAEDSVIVDTTGNTFRRSVQVILKIVNERLNHAL